MNTETNQISVPEDVQGFKTGKFAKRLLKIYCVLHLIGTIIGASILSYDPSRYNSSEINWAICITYMFVGIGTLVIIYTIANLLIQQYNNTVATREALYFYINHQLEKEKQDITENN
ncbi:MULTISPECIES: hypothetical protein [unclassified Facklamia]|uniref:hypothetical protein n=1 Tax=Aerococcaceae TaxID=186827 RepID=UPI0013BA4EE8|nr:MULTISPECIES: hypothetical protein [unclassified Facklamia]NEW64290.1 hypothetical protein [Facklamia sp. 252]NEW67873.1 hypothetical protein [Facklamia sp. 253]QQD64755.1 hypothetical protein JDW14_05300 [Aerococcaceae bacterium zg-252]